MAQPLNSASPPQSLQSFIPPQPVCHAAFNYAQTHLSPSILNHSLRVFLYAQHLAGHPSTSTSNPNTDSPYELTEHNITLLFIASLFHDIGTSHIHDGALRFEIEGANAAKSFALSHSINGPDAHRIWVAIAVHTSPQIAERIDPLAKLVRLGVLVDFSAGVRGELGMGEYVAVVEGRVARLDVEKDLGDKVVEQAVRNPGKAPAASWPSNLLRAHLREPEWEGVNKDFHGGRVD